MSFRPGNSSMPPTPARGSHRGGGDQSRHLIGTTTTGSAAYARVFPVPEAYAPGGGMYTLQLVNDRGTVLNYETDQFRVYDITSLATANPNRLAVGGVLPDGDDGDGDAVNINGDYVAPADFPFINHSSMSSQIYNLVTSRTYAIRNRYQPDVNHRIQFKPVQVVQAQGYDFA